MFERTFWPLFYKDLNQAQKIVHIVSPYITVNGGGRLCTCLRDLVNRGVKVVVHTRYAADHDELMKVKAGFIRALQSMGVNFRFISGLHRKIAIIDDRISWAGSLNILSWNDTLEQMNRFESADIAVQFIRCLKPHTENRASQGCRNCV